MLTVTLKTKTASLLLFALATLMTVVSSVTDQTSLEENFSSGFEEWTVVNPTGPLQAIAEMTMSLRSLRWPAKPKQ
tara:strand:- start:129 stop:356 length:228 start_codon:yes stop_codon:yes gene_type:complete